MLKYGHVGTDEQEVTIRLDAMDGQAHICSTWPKWSRRLEKRYGLPIRYEERDGFITVGFWVVDGSRVSVRSLPKKSNLSRPAATESPVSDVSDEKTTGRPFRKRNSVSA